MHVLDDTSFKLPPPLFFGIRDSQHVKATALASRYVSVGIMLIMSAEKTMREIASFLCQIVVAGLCLTAATADVEYSTRQVNIGQYFSAYVGNNVIAKETLPKWLNYNGSYIHGVPQIENVPDDKVERIVNGTTDMMFVQFDLTENKTCGYEQAIFMEIMFEDIYKEYTPTELSEIFQDFALTMDVPIEKLRAFPASYLRVWREETNVIFSNVEELDDDSDERLVLVWVLGCDRFDENDEYPKTAQVVNDNKYEFRVVEGIQNDVTWNSADLLKLYVTQEHVNAVTEYPFRTTRRINNPPKKMKSLPSYTCIRGKKCILNIPDDTFVDELPANQILYSVHPIEHEENFLYAQFPTMQGVALKPGSYKFRLEARDVENQAASAPFLVTVTDEAVRDFGYELVFDKDFKSFDGIQTCTLIDRLGAVLRLDANKIRITELKQGKGQRQSIVKFNYVDFHKNGECDVDEIKRVNRLMTTKTMVLPKFISQVGQQFFVRSVKLHLDGKCEYGAPLSETSDKPIHKAGVKSMPETTNVKAREDDSMLLNFILPVALIALFLVLAIFAVIYCCLFRKPTKKERKALTYVTKGQPVVFPNEVSHEDDIASVSVPMLAKDERPPLKPLEITTIHENPLYRAPTRTSVSTTNSQLNTSSTPRSTVAPNQRLPPSYTADLVIRYANSY
uniref:DAG1 domain-containing protein n=1 Tax=Panagrellus redivivus TaxID=6233 RepID=A0A7E4UYE1_PANRE